MHIIHGWTTSRKPVWFFEKTNLQVFERLRAMKQYDYLFCSIPNVLRVNAYCTNFSVAHSSHLPFVEDDNFNKRNQCSLQLEISAKYRRIALNGDIEWFGHISLPL